MISLLGSLLGFGSSLIGPVLEAWNKSSDQKHELAMLHAQAEVQSKIQDQKLEATIVEADMAEIVAAHKWKNGKLTGQGSREFLDGSKYVGEFKNGNYHGYGTYIQDSNLMKWTYVGEWKAGFQHGQGRLTTGPSPMFPEFRVLQYNHPLYSPYYR